MCKSYSKEYVHYPFLFNYDKGPTSCTHICQHDLIGTGTTIWSIDNSWNMDEYNTYIHNEL